MRIAFYAPLKSPDHPVPSGDRQMARLLIAALRHAGHTVDLLSTFRSFTTAPDSGAIEALGRDAAFEVERLAAAWGAAAARPDLLFTYHLYYKAPDLIGPPLALRFGLPYATAEASHAAKRLHGPWRTGQAHVDAAVRTACVNVCFTANDHAGLAEIVEPARLVSLAPFIDASRFGARARRPSGPAIDLVTVAMMRPGDKRDSYAFLAAALARLTHLDWRLTIVGDGPARAEVERAFGALPRERLRFLGILPGAAVPRILADTDLFVWPGFNEAFGLSYLEAQACGLPVVAVRGEGTPSVVRHGDTGFLTSGDVQDYAAAVERLMSDGAMRDRFGANASRFVHGERTVPQAAARLDSALRQALGRRAGRAAVGA